MAIRKSVFASGIERKNFKSLDSKWSQRVRIYPNLPISRIIETSDLALNDNEERQLLKASVDYTLCSENDEPILSIKLDGMEHGFNVGHRYVTEMPIERSRHYMMELKLKVATSSAYPFFVVSPPDFEPLGENLEWSIVDGVVGSILSRRRLNQLAKEFSPESIGMSQGQFDNLSEPDRDELIQDWVISTELECELQLNPLAELEAKLKTELRPIKTSYRRKTKPDINGISDPVESAQAFLKVVRWICECTVEDPVLGSFTAGASVPNFDGLGILGLKLSKQIAAIAALGSLRAKKKPQG